LSAGRDFTEFVLPVEQSIFGGKRRLQGDTRREANSDEVTELRKENDELKQLVAEVSLKNRVLKKSLNGLE